MVEGGGGVICVTTATAGPRCIIAGGQIGGLDLTMNMDSSVVSYKLGCIDFPLFKNMSSCAFERYFAESVLCQNMALLIGEINFP